MPSILWSATSPSCYKAPPQHDTATPVLHVWMVFFSLQLVLCCCSGIDLHFSYLGSFISRRQNASPSWAVWWLRGPMLIFAYDCLYRWTWYLQAFGNCSQGWTRLFFPEVLADLFLFFHDFKQRDTDFEGRPWNTSTGTPPIDSNYVNSPIRSF